jgi:hypothetical protein
MGGDMTINYDVLQDEDTGRWFFIIFTKVGEDVYESNPGFFSEEEAVHAALNWIANNLIEEQSGD